MVPLRRTAGNAEAQYRLAVSYEQGWGGSKDYAVAADWYRRAAEQGYGLASESLGYLYSRGDGVPKDYVEAMKWYRLAVDQGGFSSALVGIGLLYDRGEGVSQDGAEAMKWYRRALDHGDKNVEILIGHLYLHGNGVPQNYVMAHMWFNLAAATGDRSAKSQRDEAETLMTSGRSPKRKLAGSGDRAGSNIASCALYPEPVGARSCRLLAQKRSS